MKILVIGNGFLAKLIIRKLEDEGHRVLIYSRTKKEGIRSQQIVGDIFSYHDFIKVLSWKPQVIVHTAWTTSQGLYTHDLSNNRYGKFTSDLAHHLVTTKVEHLIVLGSCAEYGSQFGPSTAGITKLNPENLYAKQKVFAFNSAKAALHGSGVRLSWARIFQPYGPGQDGKRLLPYLIHALKYGEEIELRDTSSILDWITTKDIASAISWIIQNETPTEVDVGTSNGYTNIELLRHLEAFLGNTNQWARLAEQNSKSKNTLVVGSGSPLLKSGWLPADDLNAGLQRVLDS
jgi:nucleoside-diphosphate-sugar epimerase